MAISKKKFEKKKLKNKDAVHWEGKHYCDCKVRNFRKWIGEKRYPMRYWPEWEHTFEEWEENNDG